MRREQKNYDPVGVQDGGEAMTEKGVNFCEHLYYVPEVHLITGNVLCEMEDEGNVFKVRKCCVCDHTLLKTSSLPLLLHEKYFVIAVKP